MGCRGSLRPPPQNARTLASFWGRVVVDEDDDACWVWLGQTCHGYGVFQVHRGRGRERSIRASRVALFFATGRMEETARHSCDNTLCVNPHHLRWGTQTDNVRDMIERGRMAVGAKRWATKLDENKVREIRRLFHQEGYAKKRLARQFGVYPRTVIDIVRKRTWKHVQ